LRFFKRVMLQMTKTVRAPRVVIESARRDSPGTVLA
jgi:hypothetical protein